MVQVTVALQHLGGFAIECTVDKCVCLLVCLKLMSVVVVCSACLYCMLSIDGCRWCPYN